MWYLVGYSEEVCGDVAHSNAKEHKQLHKVPCHQGIHARPLQPIVQRIAKADDAKAEQQDILPSIAKLHHSSSNLLDALYACYVEHGNAPTATIYMCPMSQDPSLKCETALKTSYVRSSVKIFWK